MTGTLCRHCGKYLSYHGTRNVGGLTCPGGGGTFFESVEEHPGATEAVYQDPRGDLPCPFCAGQIRFPTNDEGKHESVMHTLPACPTYLNTEDAMAFVKICNLEVAKRRGVGIT